MRWGDLHFWVDWIILLLFWWNCFAPVFFCALNQNFNFDIFRRFTRLFVCTIKFFTFRYGFLFVSVGFIYCLYTLIKLVYGMWNIITESSLRNKAHKYFLNRFSYILSRIYKSISHSIPFQQPYFTFLEFSVVKSFFNYWFLIGFGRCCCSKLLYLVSDAR